MWTKTGNAKLQKSGSLSSTTGVCTAYSLVPNPVFLGLQRFVSQIGAAILNPRTRVNENQAPLQKVLTMCQEHFAASYKKDTSLAG